MEESKRLTLAPNITLDSNALQDVLNAILGLAEWNDRLFSALVEFSVKQECLIELLKSKRMVTEEEIRALQDPLRAGISVERAFAGKQTAVERMFSHFSRLLQEAGTEGTEGESSKQ
jgi:rRNA-processing protein FCF1